MSDSPMMFPEVKPPSLLSDQEWHAEQTRWINEVGRFLPYDELEEELAIRTAERSLQKHRARQAQPQR